MKKHVLLLSVPLMQIKQPAPAIYYLKGQLEAANISCTAIDTNIILYDRMKDRWTDIEYTLSSWCPDPMVEFYSSILETWTAIVDENIQITDPVWVGLSIFSHNSRRLGTDICKFIRHKYPDIKIVIGGTGLGNALGDTQFQYAKDMLQHKLIDHYITGEGEFAIVDLISNCNPQGNNINSPPIQIKNVENIVFANYEDCDHSLYPWKDYDYGVPTYVLTGSRGCVRRCDFCDVYKLWPDFTSRSGDHIAKEMIHHYEQRGVSCFYFSDSLVNGSMKAFRELCNTLIKYQNTHGMNFIWGGQFICRTNSQMSTNDYILSKNAGLSSVGIGVEHASERIRKLMRKGFDNKALNDTINNLSVAGINTMLNFMSGHPMETEADFEENIKFLHTYKWASDNGIIASLNLQNYIVFLDGTDFANKKDDLVTDDVGEFWKSKHVDLDFPEVHRRRKLFGDRCLELGWRSFNEEVYMDHMDNQLAAYLRMKDIK